jgi:thiol-disulfide isomerase/thioredoxin
MLYRRAMRLGLVVLALLCATVGVAGGQGAKLLAGAELVGTQAKEWTVGPEWANSKPLRLSDLRGRVVMVRFWTDRCHFCAASLPAMQKLADEFRKKPVTFVGIYHSKPRGSERPWSVAVARAKELGVRFPVAYDHMWKTVRAWWLEGGGRRATSSSFVIGADGRIVFVHPGPMFCPGEDCDDAQANSGYERIRGAIRGALVDLD